MSDMSTLTFPERQTTLGVSIEPLSRAHITRGAGGLVAVILTTILCNMTSRDDFVWMIMGIVSMVVCLLWLPWCSSLSTVLPAYAGLGLGEFMCLTASIVLICRIWMDRKRDVIIHVMFAFKALASAIVPQTTRHLVNAAGNWTLPGITFRPPPNMDNNSLSNDHEVHQIRAPRNESGEYTVYVGIVQMYIPKLFPVFLITSTLAVLCVVLMIGVLTHKQCTLSKRKETQRKVKKIQKKLFKKQIRLIRPKDQIGKQNGHVMTVNNGVIHQNGHADGAIDSSLPKTPTPETEEQINKLLEYTKYLQTQESMEGKSSKSKKKTKKSPKDSWLLGNQTFGIASQMYLYVFFTLAGGLTISYSQFLYMYAGQYMSQSFGYEDDLVFTLFWGSVAVSRFIAIPVSRILSPNAIMITCLVTNMSASAIMVAHAAKYPVLLWLFGGLIGSSIGMVLPGGFTWANIYYNLKAAKSIGLIFSFWAVGTMLFPWCSGFVVQNWGLPSLFYMTISTAGLAFILYIPILITFSKRRHYEFGSKRSSVSSLPTRTYL